MLFDIKPTFKAFSFLDITDQNLILEFQTIKC